ncbi:MAG: hypothetical protein H0T76_10680 [Nannocystis sp.]|nr:pre-peptidase C-terminal domain-containing protein [Nannocystis sp.]MBA3546937.1 hypothetical protein [Nannocystis sp.]
MHLPRLVPALLVLATPLAGCDAPTDTVGDDTLLVDYREAWGTQDNPSLLDANFNYTFTQLPTSGAAKKTPWAGSYWPTWQDGINARWAGADTDSAAKKYELAFGKSGVENAVSAHSGVDSLFGGTPCTSDAQCAAEQGSMCAKRTGEASGTCSATWFGICHAWAPAAILEDEPKQAVVFNGVEFKVNDLKALMSLAYTDDLDVKFVSLRCDEDEAGVDLGGLAACKDTNAGTFHVVVANLLGLRGEAFIEDRTYDDEVWNQPVRSFKVTRNIAVTGLQANKLLAAGKALSTVEHSGTAAAGTWTQVHDLAVKPGQSVRVRMSGTGDADLYLRWNAQPGVNAYQCRPFRPGTEELCEIVVPADAKTAYIAVNGYAASSKYKVTTTLLDVPASTYAFNPKAASLRQIQSELHWIGESESDVDGNLAATIDQFTKKDVYDYVLELDAAGKVIGGEWISGSRINHPDFLWKPLQKHPGTVAAVLEYADVRKLFDLANGAGAPAAPLANESSSVAAGAWKHYGPFTGDAAGLEAVLTIVAGDADLYVRNGSKPTTSAHDCRPYLDGTATETCTLGAGNWYIAVHGYATTTDFKLDVTRGK